MLREVIDRVVRLDLNNALSGPVPSQTSVLLSPHPFPSVSGPLNLQLPHPATVASLPTFGVYNPAASSSFAMGEYVTPLCVQSRPRR